MKAIIGRFIWRMRSRFWRTRRAEPEPPSSPPERRTLNEHEIAMRRLEAKSRL